MGLAGRGGVRAVIPDGEWYASIRYCLFCGLALAVEICHSKEPPDRTPQIQEYHGRGPHTGSRCEEVIQRGGRGRYWEALT